MFWFLKRVEAPALRRVFQSSESYTENFLCDQDCTLCYYYYHRMIMIILYHNHMIIIIIIMIML